MFHFEPTLLSGRPQGGMMLRWLNPALIQDNNLVLAIGLLMAGVLLALGAVLGARVARNRRTSVDQAMQESDRQRVLNLLQELGSWTSEYSGSVSEYQTKLDEMTKAVSANPPSQSEGRVLILLSQIMESNDALQTRLDAAERQLEKQTAQIESYLTEARTDGLTGLFNRRAFDQKLEEMFVNYRNGGRSFVVVLLDIDHFKVINDTYGHQAGDRVLQQLAQLLRITLRDAKIVARFGGEEFAAIVNGPLRVAADQLNELRKQISKQRIDSDNGVLEVTVSIGLSEPRDDLVVAPVLRRADEALYAAKNIGRNRVYYHDGTIPTLVGAPEIAKG